MSVSSVSFLQKKIKIESSLNLKCLSDDLISDDGCIKSALVDSRIGASNLSDWTKIELIYKAD